MSRFLNLFPRKIINGQGLIFDGIQNYVNLGTIGNFGSNFSNGFYGEVEFQSKQKTRWDLGNSNNTKTSFKIAFNVDQNFSTSIGKILVQLIDHSGNQLIAATASDVKIYDGAKHKVVVQANFTTKTVTITLDGESKTVNYASQATLNNFSDFIGDVYLGATNSSGSPARFVNGTIFSLKLGTSSLNLYGNYQLTEGTGDTVTDSSGNGNNGTRTGTPKPAWNVRRTITRSPIQGVITNGSNHLSLGTLGNYGSSLNGGFYCKIKLKPKQITRGTILGARNSATGTAISIQLNTIDGMTNSAGRIRVYLKDKDGKLLLGYTPVTKINDGQKHTIEVRLVGSPTNTITVSVDGVPQTITYDVITQAISFLDFTTPIIVGGRNTAGTIDDRFRAEVYYVQIGTSSSNLYGNYQLTEGTGTTARDSSGGGNNATLSDTTVKWITRKMTPTLYRVNPIAVSLNNLEDANEATLRSIFADMQGAGVRRVRAQFIMADIQATEGVFDYTNYDEFVDIALEYNIEIIALLLSYGMPAWASPSGSMYAPTPAVFQAWCQDLATHYTGKITLYEIANEPNFDIYWPPDPSAAEYVALLAAGYAGVKVGNPSAKVISAGLGTKISTDSTGIKTETYLQSLYDNNFQNYCDYVAFHPYSYVVFSGNLQDNLTNLDSLRKIMIKNGDQNKKVIITEMGWTTYTGGVTEADQAANILKFYKDVMMGKYKYVEIVSFYNWSNANGNPADPEGNYGIVTNTYVHKPAYESYVTAKKIYDATFTEINL